MKRKLEKGESQLQAGTRNPNVNTKHFLGGGWEEGKGEEQVEEKSGRKGVIMILASVTNTTTADYWVQIKINIDKCFYFILLAAHIV